MVGVLEPSEGVGSTPSEVPEISKNPLSILGVQVPDA